MTIKQNSPSNPTWSMLKLHLSQLEQKELLALIRDLYAANKANQAFLHARFALGDDVLEPYKKAISRWVCPDVMHNQAQQYSISKAKKAISDYKRAVGQPEGMAELSVFYCESCADYLSFCGVDDDVYFDAMVRMFEQALKIISQLENTEQDAFVDRLNEVRLRESHSWSYYVVDEMNALMNLYRFDESEE